MTDKPTDEEIQTAYDGITKDGSLSKLTLELSNIVATNPLLLDHIARAESVASIHGLMKPMLMGSLIYGLNLGLRIGEARNGNQTAKEG